MSADASQVHQLAAELGAAGLAASRRAQVVVAKTAHDIVATAQQIVPVDTSATKQSIHATLLDGGLVAEVGPTTEYAYFLEYGTVKMAPHAFMGPSLDRHAPGFVEGMEQITGVFGGRFDA